MREQRERRANVEPSAQLRPPGPAAPRHYSPAVARAVELGAVGLQCADVVHRHLVAWQERSMSAMRPHTCGAMPCQLTLLGVGLAVTGRERLDFDLRATHASTPIPYAPSTLSHSRLRAQPRRAGCGQGRARAERDGGRRRAQTRQRQRSASAAEHTPCEPAETDPWLLSVCCVRLVRVVVVVRGGRQRG